MDNGEAALAKLDAAERRGERGDTPEAWDFNAHYWLARPAFSKEFAAEVWRRYKKHSEQWTAEGDPIAQAVWKSYRTYHGISTTNPLAGSADIDLVENGEFGELLSMSINHYRSLIRHKLALNTAQRAAWAPQARTSGADAMKQVRVARSVCDYYWTAKRFDQRNYDQAELMEMAGAGFGVQGWDYNAGFADEGDVWAMTVPPWEMCHQDVKSYGDCKIWIFPRWESRADWAARKAEKQPDVARRLWELGVDEMFTCNVKTLRDDVERHETDQIPLLYVYVSPSTSCPQGRLAIIAQDDMVLVDSPMPFGRVAPVSRMCAAEYSGTAVPLANSWSMLPLMDGLYVAVTALITRLDFGAIPDLAIDEDTEFEQGDFGGLNLLKMGREAQKPTLIDVLQIPSVLPELIKMFVGTMEAITGINSVTRGQPDPNITSGSMAALIQAMSAQYNSAEDRAYNMALGEMGTHLISIVQRMASEGLLVSIAGEDERYVIQKFRAEELNQITRVEVTVVPALLKTLGGKMQIADKLLDKKLIKHAEDYLAFLETGSLSDVTSPATDQLANIKSENERMRRGESVQVLFTDNPYLHMQGHGAELDTDARNEDPEFTQRVAQHIKEHYQVANSMSLKTPDMCVALGWQPFPQAASMAAAVQQMRSGGGMPTPALPAADGQPEPKAKPGPAAAPKGQEQPEAAPAMPEPAKPEAPVAPAEPS